MKSSLAHSISFRIVVTTVIGLVLTLMAVGYTLLLSWQLEGGAAAINEAGSLRMRSMRIALALQQPRGDIHPVEEIAQFDASLQDLQRGDPRRPLVLPEQPEIQAQMQRVEQEWRTVMRPLAQVTLNSSQSQLRAASEHQYRQAVVQFVDQINQLVSLVEVELAEKTSWLRRCQTALIAMAICATVTLLYLLFLWIIRPVNRMQAVVSRMAQDDLDVRLPVETTDEFGQLALSFNQMADHVQQVYQTLEERVAIKTLQLQNQNNEVTTLYEVAAFLAGPHGIDQLCEGFLHQLMQRLGAAGGTVRILDPQQGTLHIAVHEGLSKTLTEKEHCLKVGDCLCGSAAQQGITLVRDFRKMSPAKPFPCEKEGFATIAVFQIMARQQLIGSFTLHFKQERELAGDERRLLETLGQHLGVAIDNQRLIAKEKELAVAQERNLLAQGLHDSIAQGLNFLNLQVQMLDDSLKRHALSEVADIVPLLKTGVEESYQDVRELLSNFRSRLQNTDLVGEINMVLDKFKRQTGIAVKLEHKGSGAPLPTEHQLQLLFILQEALSNIRKHAQASKVSVSLNNDQDLDLDIVDDGQGFVVDDRVGEADGHVGLHIMQERANRLSATLHIQSQPGSGTRITLRLPRETRLAA